MFVVSVPERNNMDQKWLEKELFELNRNVRVIYVTLLYAAEHGRLKNDKTYWM